MKQASWPQEVCRDDPFRRERALFRARKRGIDAPEFSHLLCGILAGDATCAAALGVDRPLSHNYVQPRVTSDLASLAECAQLATDMAPHLGLDGVVRLLGEVWLDLDARLPRDRRALLAALAASCFMQEEDDRHDRSPFEQWVRRKPIPSVAERVRFRAIDHEPHRLCHIRSRGATWTLEDALDGGLITVDPSRLAHLLCDEGPAVIARLAYTTEGRVATVGWVLPKMPDLATVARYRQVRVWLNRLEERRATVETVMRDSPWVREVIRLATVS